ncbi:MAG: CoA pyrophosphatase [Betaproteobacteria bacterium]
MDVNVLRAALLPEPDPGQFVHEEGALDLVLTPAAVLFPIVAREEGYTVLLTQRAAHLRDHPGQVSFPGGRMEEEDPSPLHTALRETEEEIGLPRERITLLGYLPEYRTGTGFRVTPVVALVAPPMMLKTDPFEVAEVFEVPLSFLLDPANHRRHSLHYRGALREFYAMPYGDYFIWGATAGMIKSLSVRLESIGTPDA